MALPDRQIALPLGDAAATEARPGATNHPSGGSRWCDEEEGRLMLELERHRGRDRAIKLPALAAALGIQGREIQNIVAHLVEDHGLAIGGCSRGIYMIETAEELNEVCATLKHRALATLKHMAALRRQHLAELLGQLRLEI